MKDSKEEGVLLVAVAIFLVVLVSLLLFIYSGGEFPDVWIAPG